MSQSAGSVFNRVHHLIFAASRPLGVFVAALIALIGANRAKATDLYAFTTFAGAPGIDYADGTAPSVRFGLPEDVIVDAAGNAFVSDNKNAVIRVILPSGVVFTLAGLGRVPGYVDGTGNAARFNSILGLAFDQNGNVIVCDSGNSVIRRVTRYGVVTTVAGVAQTPGAVDGAAAVARFSSPADVAVDSTGNIYVADSGNDTIRKIALDGTVSTIAGTAGVPGSADGVGIAASFSRPDGIAIDAAGNLYVADTGNNTIRKIAATDRTVSTLAGVPSLGAFADGVGRTARFNNPERLAIDAAGNVIVADDDNQAIRRIQPDGTVTTVAGAGNTRGFADGTATSARFFFPHGVCVDSTGAIWIADTYNSSIRKLSLSGTVSTIAGISGLGSADGIRTVGSFFLPYGVAFGPDGSLYVADSYNQTIRQLAPDGSMTTIAGKVYTRGSADGAGTDARFQYPHGIAVDGAGNIYVADSLNNTIRKITSGRVVVTLAGTAGLSGTADGSLGAARFNGPSGVAVDSAGIVYVADTGNDTIRRITADGNVTTLAGSAGTPGAQDGTGSAAQFNSPFGIAVDSAGILYVADTGNNVIRRITSSGVVTTFAGLAGPGAEIDGVGGSARFSSPEGIAVDRNGNLYVTDTVGLGIRKIAPDRTVTTIGGGLGTLGNGDGIGNQLRSMLPLGIAVDAFGNVFFSDYYANTIRKGGLMGVSNPLSALTNLSVRATATAGNRVIVGFNMAGGTKTVLIRGVGPGLAPYAPGSTLAGDPSLELYTPTAVMIDSNDNWGGSATFSNTFTAVGAFPLPANSLDAALLESVSGGYTAHMLTTQTGMGLVEVYDTDTKTTSTRLTNLSARYQVGTGNDVLVAGFVITGTAPKTVLIRGVGLSLNLLFGITDAVNDPMLTLFDGNQRVIGMNNDWDPYLGSAFTQVGAFQYAGVGPDSAMLVSLAPGNYTAQLSGVGGTTGNGMIEVYEVGN